MYHSINFELIEYTEDGIVEMAIPILGQDQVVGKNTWDDWHLIPTERPSLSSPGVSSNLIEIPGRDGTYDLTRYLTGDVTFGDRSGTWEFYVDNDHEGWNTIKRNIMNYLHGKRMRVSLEDDPGFFWEGRFAVDSWKSEASNSKIAINYQVGPYKTRISPEGGAFDIEWDTFNFETDYHYFMIFGTRTVTKKQQSVRFEMPDYNAKMLAQVTVKKGETVYLKLVPHLQTGRSVGWMKVTNGLAGPTGSYLDIGNCRTGDNTVYMKGSSDDAGTVTLSMSRRSL